MPFRNFFARFRRKPVQAPGNHGKRWQAANPGPERVSTATDAETQAFAAVAQKLPTDNPQAARLRAVLAEKNQLPDFEDLTGVYGTVFWKQPIASKSFKVACATIKTFTPEQIFMTMTRRIDSLEQPWKTIRETFLVQMEKLRTENAGKATPEAIVRAERHTLETIFGKALTQYGAGILAQRQSEKKTQKGAEPAKQAAQGNAIFKIAPETRQAMLGLPVTSTSFQKACADFEAANPQKMFANMLSKLETSMGGTWIRARTAFENQTAQIKETDPAKRLQQERRVLERLFGQIINSSLKKR